MAALRILLVHGDSAVREGLRQRIRDLGHSVTMEAEDGVSGLHMARQSHPDLVMSHMCTSHLCGLEMAEQVDREGIAPVILMPDKPCAKLQEKAKNLYGCVSPHCDDSTTLEGAIEVAASRFQMVHRLSTSVDELSEQIQTRKLVDRAKGELIKRFGYDEPTAHRWIQKRSMDTRKSLKEVAEAVLLMATVDTAPAR